MWTSWGLEKLHTHPDKCQHHFAASVLPVSASSCFYVGPKAHNAANVWFYLSNYFYFFTKEQPEVPKLDQGRVLVLYPFLNPQSEKK